MNSINPSYEYDASKKVKIGCNDCNGCSKCCTHMGDTIVLDPYDMHMLTSDLKLADGSYATYEILTCEDGPLELSLHDELLLPNIKMVDEGACPFLNSKGRCMIHPIRTGLCRLYPLGRNIYPDRLTYFVLDADLGCPAKNKSYVDIKDWLAIPDYDQYENFQIIWHNFKKQLSLTLQNPSVTETQKAQIREHILQAFYATPYEDNFYTEFYNRLIRTTGLAGGLF